MKCNYYNKKNTRNVTIIAKKYTKRNYYNKRNTRNVTIITKEIYEM